MIIISKMAEHWKTRSTSGDRRGSRTDPLRPRALVTCTDSSSCGEEVNWNSSVN